MASSVGVGTLPVREGRTSSEWFREHYEEAASAIIDFLGGDGIHFAGKEIADIGSGDGIIDLGLALKGSPERLVGFDIVPTDTEELLLFARREGVADELPANLEFRQSDVRSVPAAPDSFDIVVSWSTFEHVDDPRALLRDIHRVLRPHVLLMIQIWPLYHSQHGSHLWQYFPEGFVQLLRSQAEVEEAVRAKPGPDTEWAEELITQFRSCNEITVDGLQRDLSSTGFKIHKVELMSEAFHLPPGLERYPLSLIGISGLKLLASTRARSDD
jgi:SAM-dependent methyltransferase